MLTHLTTDAPQACGHGVDTTFVALGPLKIAILGVVQGITELLPVSSTAHMRAIPAFLGWPDPGSAFSAAMQLAALVAVLSYFRADVAALWSGTVAGVRSRDWRDPRLRLPIGLVLASIPLVVGGALLSPVLNACQSPLRAPVVVGIACIVMAALLALAELLARHRRTAESVSLRDALIIGIAQAGALIPGVSRSGSTLTAALGLGFTREDAARVSFLLGIPAIALAGFHELWLLYRMGLSAEGWSVLAVGLVTSSVSSFIAIWGLMRFLERFSTWPFIVYRALFGVALLAQVFLT